MLDFLNLAYTNSVGLIPEPYRTITMLVLLGVFVLVSIFKAVQRVPAGHTGMLLFLDRVVLYYNKKLPRHERRRQKAVDKALIRRKKLARYGRPRELQPGFRKMIPYFNKIEVVDTRGRTFSLGEVQGVSKTTRYTGSKFIDVRIPVNVSLTYFWQYRTDNAEQRLIAIAKTELASVLRENAPDDGILTPEVVERISYLFLKAVYFQFDWNGAKATSLLLGTEMTLLEGWLPQAVSSLKDAKPPLTESDLRTVASAIGAGSYLNS